jgi:hypothetical protein
MHTHAHTQYALSRTLADVLGLIHVWTCVIGERHRGCVPLTCRCVFAVTRVAAWWYMCCLMWTVFPWQPLAVELAGDLMFQLTPSSLSTYSIPLKFVEDWATMAPLFLRELECGKHMTVQRVGTTFIVADPAPEDDTVCFSHPNRAIMMWLLLTVGDRRVDVRLHHPPGSFALSNKDFIMAALQRGIARIVHSVNT